MSKDYPECTLAGGYPIIYFDSLGDIACGSCASREGLEAGRNRIYWEGPKIECDYCFKDIESAYGDGVNEDEC